MGSTETTAAGLRQLGHEYPKVLAMFPADPCAAGERRQPIHALFATNKAYAGIQFLRLPVQERALVKPAWPQDGAPFFLCDDHARLVHGQTLATQQRLRARLPALSHHPGN